MERGLYIAATGMLSDIARQDAIANNLANASTVGYKSDEVVNQTFGDMLLQNVANGRVEGSVNMGTRVVGTVTNLDQGALRQTDEDLNVAIQGDGFFPVQTDQGTRYTRDGQLQLDPRNRLVDASGNLLLGVGGQPISVKNASPAIGDDGTVTNEDGTVAGKLAVVALQVPGATKTGDGLWEGTPSGTPAGTTVRQGYLEQSSTNSVQAMVDMISVMRSYESSQKAMQAIDGALDKAVNQVGVVNG